jgi:hypothetical protein
MPIQLAAYFLATSLLNLTRATWNFSYAILYDIGYDPYTTIIPLYVIVVSPILYTWVTVVLFGLLIVIGYKKTNGLWSQQQQFYGGVPQQQQFYGGVPQQQQFYGVGQGQGVPTSQPIGPNYKPNLQPAPAEIIGGGSPTWRAELTGTNYTNPTQQHYGTQYQQQPQVVQNQVTQTYEVAGSQNERA